MALGHFSNAKQLIHSKNYSFSIPNSISQ